MDDDVVATCEVCGLTYDRSSKDEGGFRYHIGPVNLTVGPCCEDHIKKDVLKHERLDNSSMEEALDGQTFWSFATGGGDEV